ncbi:MAG: metallopeptidase family protein [Candidatus Aminicenantes bacterium]|nr:metallopeptidase family protein [Candidatus Aminicenantes bacterium]
MITLSRADFETLVEQAVETLPRRFKDLMKNVAVMVEDFPSPEILRDMGFRSRWDLLGLYHGVPYEHRGSSYGNVPPDVILLFQKPIERICETEEDVGAQIRETVIHEVAHYFGFSEEDLGRVERETRPKNKKERR